MGEETDLKVEDGKERGRQKQFRLVLNRESIDALDSLVAVVNDGFNAGSVSKSDLAGYLFRSARKLLTKSEIAKIHAEFFDERKALEHLVREAEVTGKLPDEIRKLLKSQIRTGGESSK